ncbi:unnamed protein product [Vicia faba]|uniref:Uncharacterized protein n=1 Tax=Vicia faba TaxID=3906 RepID=A0AAV0YVD2_VICFA|nr:unnamed protein product [Vicia faba]
MTSETTYVPHASEAEAPTTAEVTPHTSIEAPTLYTATKAPGRNDMEVTPSVETEITTSTLTELFVHTDEGFSGGPNECFVFTGYVDHVAFILV